MLGAVAALVLIAVPGLALAEDIKFKIINNSARAVNNFYTSPSDADTWQEDVLGDNTIAAGETEEITITGAADGQCSFDMRFIMEDKAELVEKGIDVCKLASYTLSDAK